MNEEWPCTTKNSRIHENEMHSMLLVVFFNKFNEEGKMRVQTFFKVELWNYIYAMATCVDNDNVHKSNGKRDRNIENMAKPFTFKMTPSLHTLRTYKYTISRYTYIVQYEGPKMPYRKYIKQTVKEHSQNKTKHF